MSDSPPPPCHQKIGYPIKILHPNSDIKMVSYYNNRTNPPNRQSIIHFGEGGGGDVVNKGHIC